MVFESVCVLGLGYIGLPTASTFATNGLRVVGVDVNPQIIASLQNGELHIYEPGLRDVVQAAMQSGNLVIRSQVEPADAFIIAVPTPFHADKSADMRYVVSAAEMILPQLRRGNLVVLESTSPPRTTLDLLRPILERSGLTAGQDFLLAYTPERVLPGQILRELVENTRIIGGLDPASAEAGRDLYRTFVRGEILLTDATTAEMVKLMENTTRDVNIAIANEFARLADRFGVDVWEAISLANRHPRVKILNPGPGVGGHCISVDPWFFVDAAPDITPLIRTARQVNDTQPHFVIDWLGRILGSLEGRKVAALGLAFKPDVDDLRESPAIEIAQLLQQNGAEVLCFDPFKPDAKLPGLQTCQSLVEAISQAEILMMLVGHAQLRALDPVALRQLSPARIAVDMVNGWPGAAWSAAGFELHRLGVGQRV
ncbi:MAG TPA: nucleotide sugar dehydrogenase [Anaerolineaceae bacterium]|nr:nucleotide sugar dehydrogenase [Anaerolineaceae bacterium]